MNTNEAQTNTAVQYVEGGTITKIQASGGTGYIFMIGVFAAIGILAISSLFGSKKDRGESDEEYLTRTRDAAKRSKQVQEENPVLTKENPQGESMKDYFTKKK